MHTSSCLLIHTTNWQVKWQLGSSRAKGEPGSTLHACVPMSTADCMNSQSNKMYFTTIVVLLLMMMNMALWQWAQPFSDGHVHPDNNMSSWLDVLSHWVTCGWLSTTAISSNKLRLFKIILAVQSGNNPAYICNQTRPKVAFTVLEIKEVGCLKWVNQ
jgi:hypothetical protein